MEKTDIFVRGDVSFETEDERFKGIKDPYDLYEAFLHVWQRDTCAPRMQQEWSEDNKTKGHCSVTSFLVQDIFGGEVFGIPLGDGNYHCFNKIGDGIFDLTCGQFRGEQLDYVLDHKQSRDFHFKKEEKRLRYELLKKRLFEYMEERR